MRRTKETPDFEATIAKLEKEIEQLRSGGFEKLVIQQQLALGLANTAIQQLEKCASGICDDWSEIISNLKSEHSLLCRG